jgi:hypothetical protein
VGAIQGFRSKEPKIWMPKAASAQERLEIALSALTLLRFQPPRHH